ncbi:MAG: hypothetical protein WC213_03360 [Arenimonas sp.]|jgi:hypothetical protein
MEEATLTLYRVRLCGYYNEDDEHLFSSLADVMRGLARWTATLGSIGESSTYSVDEDADILRAFCLDIRELGNGRYLIVTWNELPRVDEGVQVLQVESQIGAAEISAVPVDALSLPGYPAFFCVDVRRHKVLNIRFDQRLNGSRQFQRFVSGFLTSFSESCVWNADDETELLGYSDEDGDDPEIAEGAVAKFATALVRVAGHTDHIRANCENIRKIVRRATIDPEVEAHKMFLDSAFQLAGMPINNRLRADIAFQYEFKTRLTPEKLDAVIGKHDENAEDTWDDVGFTLARESQKIYWLSGSVARNKAQLDVARSENGMVNIDSLEEYLGENLQRHLDSFDEH